MRASATALVSYPIGRREGTIMGHVTIAVMALIAVIAITTVGAHPF